MGRIYRQGMVAGGLTKDERNVGGRSTERMVLFSSRDRDTSFLHKTFLKFCVFYSLGPH